MADLQQSWTGNVCVSGSGVSFGTFGELLQGVLPDNNDFLVTLPVAQYAQAFFTSVGDEPTLHVFPVHKQKSRALALRILLHFHLPPGGVLTIQSDLPEGKGLASSSADLVATARAVESAFDVHLPVAVLERFMIEIEPSDGVMYNGLVCFHHRRVQLREYLGALPSLTIVGADEGGEVDTVEFNKLPKPFGDEEKQEYECLLNAMGAAIRDQDLQAVGRIATRSAALNQKLRPKHNLEAISRLSDELGGLGVVAAHSGTYVGVLLSPADPRYARQVPHVYARLIDLVGNARIFHTLSFEGGNFHAVPGSHR